MNFKSLKQANSVIKLVGHVAWARWMGGREEVRGEAPRTMSAHRSMGTRNGRARLPHLPTIPHLTIGAN